MDREHVPDGSDGVDRDESKVETRCEAEGGAKTADGDAAEALGAEEEVLELDEEEFAAFDEDEEGVGCRMGVWC